MNRRWLRTTAACGALFCGLFGAAAILAPQPRLIWNASASVPVGLYAIDVGAKYAPSDLSLARAREKCIDAKRMIAEGQSPAIEKQREKRRISASSILPSAFGTSRCSRAAIAAIF